jgi:serine/threonine protein kinase
MVAIASTCAPVEPIRRARSITRRRPRPETLAAGNRVGPWRVDYELGKGGMAAVYAVTHTRFGKRAALKLAHRTILSNEFTPETFLREARIVHLVEHAGVPDVFAIGTFDGRPYMAMERLSGSTLGELVDQDRLTRDRGLALLIEVCGILAAAHTAGVVHRDLKLDNVFVETSGRVKLLDWGVARVLAEADPLKGMIAGTLAYVAPELVTGEDVTPAADIYSLGVLAYHVLLGGAPFSGASDLELIRKHVHERPPTPVTRWPEVPPELAKILTAMLAKDPKSRPDIPTIVAAFEAGRRELQPKQPSWFERMRTKWFSATITTAATIAAATLLTS